MNNAECTSLKTKLDAAMAAAKELEKHGQEIINQVFYLRYEAGGSLKAAIDKWDVATESMKDAMPDAWLAAQKAAVWREASALLDEELSAGRGGRIAVQVFDAKATALEAQK